MRMPFLDSLPCFSAKGRDDEGRSWHRCSRVIGERRTATALALRQRTRAGSARVRQNGFQWSRALARPCRDKSKAWLVGPSVRQVGLVPVQAARAGTVRVLLCSLGG